MITLSSIGLATTLLVQVADTVPRLNVEASCRAAAAVGDGLNANASTCLESERSARRELEAQWSGFSRRDRQSCTSEATTGGDPSYVNLLECLTMARDARQMQKGGRATSGSAAPAEPPAASGARNRQPRRSPEPGPDAGRLD